MRTIEPPRYLDHPRMISSIVPWPRDTILHHPSFLRDFLRLSNQNVDANLKLLVFSLRQKDSSVYIEPNFPHVA